MKLSRSQFLTLTAASTLRLAPNRAWAGYGGGEPPYQTKYGVSSRFVQSDDKSWELTLPSSSWSLSSGSLRADPAHLFAAHASRPDASLDVTVDQIPQKKLTDLGKLAAVAETYRRDKEELLDAAEMPGRAFMSSKGLVFRFRSGSAERRVKIAVQQGRLFELAVALPADPPASLAAEVDALIESFTVFPVNAGCLAASNAGGSSIPGVCY